MFPSAAAANHSIFYDTSGPARSVSGVYSVLTSRYAAAANSSATQSALASVGGASSSATAVASADPAAALLGKASFLSQIPDVAVAGTCFFRKQQLRTSRGFPLAVPGQRPAAAGLGDRAETVGRV